MDAITHFLLPLTFGHICWVAFVVIAAIVVARLALAALIYLGSLAIAGIALLFVGLFALFNRPAKKRRYR